MAFPEDPVTTLTQWYIDQQWIDVSSYVANEAGVRISNGGRNEQSSILPTPSRIALTLNDPTGIFNTKNPNSPYFGKVGLNTRMRFWAGMNEKLDDEFTRTVSNQWTGGSFTWTLSGGTVPDDYDVNGTQGVHTHPSANVLHHSYADLSQQDAYVRASVALSAATLTGADVSAWILGKMTDTNNYVAAHLSFTTGGNVFISIYQRVEGSLTLLEGPFQVESGLSGTFDDHNYVVELSTEGHTVRATYYRESQTQPVVHTIDATHAFTGGTNAGVASRRETGNTNANLEVRFNYIRMMPGIVRATVAVTSKERIRTDADAHRIVRVDGSGKLHEITQGGNKPARSPMYREVIRRTGYDDIVAYWPCEDGRDATTLASAIANASAMEVVSGTNESLGSSSPFPGSDGVVGMGSSPTPVLHGFCPTTTATGGSSDTGTVKVRILLDVPAGGFSTDQRLIDIYTIGGSIRLWRLTYGTVGNGSLKIGGYNNSFTLVDESAYSDFSLDGATVLLGFEVTENGADVDWEIAAHYLNSDGTETGVALTDTFTGMSIGRPDEIYIGPDQGLDNATIGHVIIGSQPTSVDGVEDAFIGWFGETAAARFERICGEEDIDFETILASTASETVTMGAQPTSSIGGIFQDIMQTEMGILYEPRHIYGLGFMSRTRLYNTVTTNFVEVPFTDLAKGFAPVEDDQGVANDVTATRTNGSSARYTITDGPMRAEAPVDGNADGIGEQPRNINVNPYRDDLLPNIASWYANVSSPWEDRIPSIPISLARSAFTSDIAYFQQITRMTAGGKLYVTDPADDLPPDDIEQIIRGYTEVITNDDRSRDWKINFNTTPASPYRVFILDTSRLACGFIAGSSLTKTFLTVDEDTTSTAWQINTTDSTPWSTTDEPYDLMVDGEVVTVSTAADTTLPQDITVTRSVNGIVKEHDAATANIEIARPFVLGL